MDATTIHTKQGRHPLKNTLLFWRFHDFSLTLYAETYIN